jgi:hypothetical protein
MKSKIAIYWLLTGLLLILIYSSCRNEKHQNTSSGILVDMDSSYLKVKYAEAIFTIPSPNQTLILLKKTNTEFNPELLSSALKIEKYTTTFKKSLVLGILGADISYLYLYNQKEIALHYLDNIHNLLENLEITKPFQPVFFKKIEENFGNNDSVLIYLSELYQKCDEYLKYNDRNEIGTLIIAGGWIESFYILTKLYSKTNDKRLFTLILYQKEVLDNLIKILSPLYKKSAEYKGLIDDISNIAYAFDVVDTKESITDILSDTNQNITFVKNETKYILSGSQLEGLATLSLKLREKYIF